MSTELLSNMSGMVAVVATLFITIKKIGIDDSSDVTERLLQIEIHDKLHVCTMF